MKESRIIKKVFTEVFLLALFIIFLFAGIASALSYNWNWMSLGEGEGQAEANFSWSVSTAGDVNGDGYSDVIVGARHYDNGESNEGRAFVYHGSVSGLSNTPNWTGESNQTDADFGFSVSTAGDVNGDGYSDIIVGAYDYNGRGKVFVYHGSALGLSISPDWTAEGEPGDLLGNSVGTAGDVNGDGYSDVIIGAYWSGKAFVYHGSPSGLSTTADWVAQCDQANSSFGASVGTAGDVNGDGYSDVIIGADNYGSGTWKEGKVFVYYGSPSGLSAVPDWTVIGDQLNASFGYSVGTAGDVNGDGYSDVIVGAYTYSNVEFQEGKAFVYYGSSSGLSITADWMAESNHGGDYFGYSVSNAGDVNGDGYSDIIIGALYGEGRSFVYNGSASGLGTTPYWTANRSYSWFGFSVSTAGDVNDDNYSDVIVGAPDFFHYEGYVGAAFVYHGSADPHIGYSQSSFNFTAPQGNRNPPAQTLNITNTGGGTLNWSVSDDAAWLDLYPTSGTDNGTVTLLVHVAGLTPGTYNATITITAQGATNSPVGIPVTLTVSPTLTLLSPNGGGVIPSGLTYTIIWGAPPEAVKFTLTYSKDNGTTWVLIASNVTETSYNWQVPALLNNKKQCLVKVKAFNSQGAMIGKDKSDSVFTIEVVKLTSPDGGETLTSGTTHTITWTTNNTKNPVASVKLVYTTNGGSTWTLIDTPSGNPGSYDWTVPNVSSTNCKVKVVLKDVSGTAVGKDASDGIFEIQ